MAEDDDNEDDGNNYDADDGLWVADRYLILLFSGHPKKFLHDIHKNI